MSTPDQRLMDLGQKIIEYPNISIYTITNGTVSLNDEDWRFLENHSVNVGFSIDGYKELHDKNRGNSFDKAMHNVEEYKRVTGHYPTFNATVGEDSLLNADMMVIFIQDFSHGGRQKNLKLIVLMI